MVVTGKKLMVDREGLEDAEVVLNALSDMDSGGMFYVTGLQLLIHLKAASKAD
ncbi:hypothetical protein HK100_006704 [Physocladia obscura]|uniref:Uncharacterized protein n=1 Tax=Physocladia obscura TaxID=109957 RepID=A0AAD5SQ44_9FUNG|nr:hypothetical protein HK100_006704 [Physocladia obscura]